MLVQLDNELAQRCLSFFAKANETLDLRRTSLVEVTIGRWAYTMHHFLMDILRTRIKVIHITIVHQFDQLSIQPNVFRPSVRQSNACRPSAFRPTRYVHILDITTTGSRQLINNYD